MTISFAAITPHTPLLLPTIGKEKLSILSDTIQALNVLKKQIYGAHIDVIIIITPHGGLHKEAFTINSQEEIIGDLTEFGDLSTKIIRFGSLSLSAHITSQIRKHRINIQQTSESRMDYGSAVPLYYLLDNSDRVRVITIGFSEKTPQEHYEFGQALRESLSYTKERVAIIASGDMSHKLNELSTTETIDNVIETLIANKEGHKLTDIDDETLLEQKLCAYRSILILLGALDGINYTYTRLAYEHPFGVGYLTSSLSLE